MRQVESGKRLLVTIFSLCFAVAQRLSVFAVSLQTPPWAAAFPEVSRWEGLLPRAGMHKGEIFANEMELVVYMHKSVFNVTPI